MRVGYHPGVFKVFTDDRCLKHIAPQGFPEVPARLTSVVSELRDAGYDIEDTSAAEVPSENALRAARTVHRESYLERFRRAIERGDGLLDSADNPLSPGTWDAAWAAAEASVRAVDWTLEAPGRKAFAAVRPPGHHAEENVAMGFCYLNNAALAAAHAQEQHGIGRVAIFDFDVHHGNGTQHIFEARSDVLYASTHQYPFYPGTGAASERGVGAGEGTTINVPLAAGCGDAEYEKAFREIVLPALRDFDPDLLLISAGFDAWQDDPLGGMRVSLEGYASWGAMLAELAAEVCAGRVVELLEGGYDLVRRPDVVRHHVEGLLGGEAT